MALSGIGGHGMAMMVGWALLALLVIVFLSKTIRYIPNTRVGIVEKLISGRGSVKSGLIAQEGEAGFQPTVLRGGWHLFMPFMYRIHRMPLVTIPQGKIGYLFARDGQDLPPTQALAANVQTREIQDVVGFLRGQTRTLIQLIQERSAIQEQSGVQMKEKFTEKG
jgi:uncharacterized membrane protein YqiK